MKGVIFVNPERCMGCRSCELACAVDHSESKDLFQAIKEFPRPTARVEVMEMGGISIPLHCRHCDSPPCVAVCPTGAITKAELGGPVVINSELCIGCRSCMLVCPYGVPQLKGGGKVMVKCDFCFERLERGEVPACVEACPTYALKFKTFEETEEETRRRVLSMFGSLPYGEKGGEI